MASWHWLLLGQTQEPNYFSADAYERSLWENARDIIAKATGKK